MMRTRIGLAFVLLAVMALAAPRWVYWDTDAKGTKWFIDYNSWQWSDDRTNAKVWIKKNYADGEFRLVRYELQRNPKRFRIMTTVAYNADGTVKGTDAASTWNDIPPNTIADKLYDVAFRD